LAEPASELRFLRESEIAKTLQVSNVVRVLATSERGAPIPYIVMERLQGRDLSDLLRAQGKMRMSDVLRMLREIGCGLDAARAAGIVHRDIKPRNLFLADKPDGKTIWKILDFGVSKLANEATLTGGNLVGTPSYMAPEQASGGELSHRTDLFALGVIAYRALTGRPAFSGEEMASILFEVLTAMPPRPSDSARLHEDVDRVLAIALAKDPWERFDSGAELADALDKGSRGRLPDALRARADRLLQEHPWG
jgi:serine/threonine-protein kinase